MFSKNNRQKNTVPHTGIKKNPHVPSLATMRISPFSVKEYGVLERCGGVWRITMGECESRFPAGQYDFVCMLNGEIRAVQSTSDDMQAHTLLSGDAPSVCFAGTVRFNKYGCGSIRSWNNCSDEYVSDASLSEHVGFPSRLFCDETIGMVMPF